MRTARLLQDGQRLLGSAEPVAHEAEPHVDAAAVAKRAALQQLHRALKVLLRLAQPPARVCVCEAQGAAGGRARA
eukprot:4147058-Pleurochrysis_carterae.AAC.1